MEVQVDAETAISAQLEEHACGVFGHAFRARLA